jgi:hypothetical protein
MKKTKKYDYAANLSDGYPVVNMDLKHDVPAEPEPEVKPHIPPEKPHYGKPNFGYNFIVKYGKAMQINTFIAMVVFVCLMGVTLFMTNIDVSKHQVNATTTVTVVQHEPKQDIPTAFSKFLNKNVKGNPEMIAKFDSLMEARRVATLEEQERNRQRIRDSLAQYFHVRDSIRAELLREDSLKAELERAKKVKIDYIAVIDDGITKRTVNVNSVADSLTAENTELLGKTFHTATYQAVIDRQKEINKNKDYYKHLRLNIESLL